MVEPVGRFPLRHDDGVHEAHPEIEAGLREPGSLHRAAIRPTGGKNGDISIVGAIQARSVDQLTAFSTLTRICRSTTGSESKSQITSARPQRLVRLHRCLLVDHEIADCLEQPIPLVIRYHQVIALPVEEPWKPSSMRDIESDLLIAADHDKRVSFGDGGTELVTHDTLEPRGVPQSGRDGLPGLNVLGTVRVGFEDIDSKGLAAA